jgi:hypothetical protein
VTGCGSTEVSTPWSACPGISIRLADDDGAHQVLLVTHLQAAPDFAALSGASPASVPPSGLLQEAPKAAVERARWWERHLVEVELGLPADADPGATPRPGYDTDLTTLPKREQTKAAELTAFGQQVSVRTIRRRRGAYATSGLWGLVDQRAVKPASPTGRVDERVVLAARQALAEQTETSTGTRGRVSRQCRLPRRSIGCWLVWTPAGIRSGRPSPAGRWPTARTPRFCARLRGVAVMATTVRSESTGFLPTSRWTESTGAPTSRGTVLPAR